ncbi:Dps family protein [Sinomonas mesophila]|uniref:Dps family protein n=1 Tax=Sinomonas mesophila TaxID=1531955 RepID=UPI000986A9E4|nr:DNA starvation/stationary phase protection protein [Sinomonas mesophila]
MKASEELARGLQAVLVDLIELTLQGKQAHWNIVGPNFRDLHLQLDEIVAAARLHTDVIAERMRALHVVPDGRSATVAKTTSLDEAHEGIVSTSQAIDATVKALENTVATVRGIYSAVEEHDPATTDQLNEIILKLEQFAWMVGAEKMKTTTP